MKPYLTNWIIKIGRSDFNHKFFVVRVDFKLSDGTRHFTHVMFSYEALNIHKDLVCACKEVLMRMKAHINKL